MNSMKKFTIGLVVAIEMDAVLRKYGIPAQSLNADGFSVKVYENDAFTLYAIDAGAGEISAAISTQYLISNYHVDAVVNFGVVGALTEAVKTAQLCIVERVIHYDYDTTGWLNLPRGQYPGEQSPYFRTDRQLLEAAMEAAPDLMPVSCASADKFVDQEADKRALHSCYGAEICEMEAAGIVLTCKRNGVPCLLMKAVSDSLTGGGKEFMAEVGRVSELCFDIVDRVIRRIAG